MRKFLLATIVSILFFALCTQAQNDSISATDAKNFIGQSKTVCGLVVGGRYAQRVKGQPTFLNFEKDYPNSVFTVVIWGNDRSKFNAPENTYLKKRICVSGKIETYKATPQITVKEPAQITVK